MTTDAVGNTGPTTTSAPFCSTRVRSSATAEARETKRSQPSSSSTGFPSMVAPLTPSEGFGPLGLAPRFSSGSSAPATATSDDPNPPSQSVINPIRIASGLLPPQPPAKTANDTTRQRTKRNDMSACNSSHPDGAFTDNKLLR